MSTVEVIMAALAAGAGAGVQDATSAAVRDVYTDLKDRLGQLLGGRDEKAMQALEADTDDPDVWHVRLGQQLTALGADRDEQTLALAHQVLELADPAGSATGKYRVDARKAKGVQIGDRTTQHNTFS
jgi:hypothetical protein